ncbi:hypothetical protein V6N12_049999 [Hibiscus sabdariffa]|uniref:Uncharacterized protein n=1 Tax=Hibiscus sabdariffa TaxID=183260 RepID=A0ABR2GB56_9ROSI
MSGNRGEEDSAIKRYDSQHHNVAESRTHRVHSNLKEPSGHLVGFGLDDAAIREALHNHCQAEYEEQCQ